MRELRVTSLEEYEGAIDQLNKELKAGRWFEGMYQSLPLYRGHAGATWKLETTLERFRPKPTSVKEYNVYLSRIQPAIQSYTEKKWEVQREINLEGDSFDFSPPNYEFMVYLRHHGFPSPLLDWTRSPYIALHFAYANSRPGTDVAVYAYVSTPRGVNVGWGGGPAINEMSPYVTTHARHFRQQSGYTVCVKGSKDELAYFSHEDVFQAGNDDQNLLRKYILPSTIRREVLSRLRLVNINAYSLFASEEGLMQMLAVDEITLREP